MNLQFSHGTPYLPMRPGMGNLEPDQQQIAGIAATAVTTTVGILGSLHVAIAGLSFAGPLGIAIAGLAAVGVAIANAFAGCGQTCVAASNIANQVEAILAQNLDHYLSAPVHYRSLQLAALNNFDIAWAALVKACGNQALLQAGVNCIADRQLGSCKWKTSPGGWNGGTYTSPGQAGTGDACWNWFVGYRSPIADDPTVVPDPVPDSGGSFLGSDGGLFGNIFGGSSSGTSLLPLLLIGGATIGVLYALD